MGAFKRLLLHLMKFISSLPQRISVNEMEIRERNTAFLDLIWEEEEGLLNPVCPTPQVPWFRPVWAGFASPSFLQADSSSWTRLFYLTPLWILFLARVYSPSHPYFILYSTCQHSKSFLFLYFFFLSFFLLFFLFSFLVCSMLHGERGPILLALFLLPTRVPNWHRCDTYWVNEAIVSYMVAQI